MAEAQSDKSIKTIRELLGISPESFAVPVPSEAKAPPAPNLPIVEEVPIIPDLEVPKPPIAAPVSEQKPIEMKLEIKESRIARLRRGFTKDFVRYPVIFLVALGFFYAILNFGALSKQVSGVFNKPKATPKDAVPSDFNVAQYQKWSRKYYVYLNDPKELEPTEDPDGDGLINSQEFRLGTNPLLPDTDGDGYDDGREVLNGYNPLYEGRLTADQQKIVSEKIDTSAIASRKQLERVSGQTVVPQAPQNPQSIYSGSGWSALPDVPRMQIDVRKPGNLTIPKLGVDVAITWSKSLDQMEEDLKYGVAHHPDTPFPGERGTASIHGHSSGNPWDGNFKTIFTKLNFLEAGDEAFVTVYGTNGEVRKYRFMVRRAQVYAKTDTAQFNAGDGYFLNLSTSWPVGTARQRYVVTTELVGIQ